MIIHRPLWAGSVLLVVLASLCGCSGLLQSDPEISTSREFEPPAGWESAVAFSFADSTYFPDHPYAARIEFKIEGHRGQVITGRDLFNGPGGNIRTPWYRVPLRGAASRPLLLHVVLTDTSGAESRADYPLHVNRDHFYDVHFGVGTPRPPRPEVPRLTEGWRWYPVSPGARLQPSDSLLISYLVLTRDCFHCVF